MNNLKNNYYRNWPTSIGKWFQGEKVIIRGQDLFTDLKGITWTEMFLFQITGRRFTTDELRYLNFYWAECASYPDPRIWNNRVASLAASAKSCATFALAGGNVTSDAKIYGRFPEIRTMDLIKRAVIAKESNQDLKKFIEDEIKQRKYLYGFGRPVVREDERILPLKNLVKEIGMENGKHYQTVFEIQEILDEIKEGLVMNIAILNGAVFSDLGFEAKEYYHYSTLGFSAGMMGCYIDCLDKPEGTLFPLKCHDVEYSGEHEEKTWNS